jgi:hypothetical protein
MGWTIKIGNATPAFVDNGYGLQAYWDVEDAEVSSAPAFPNDIAVKTNSRSPSYTVWSEFCEQTGLYELFYNNESGLLKQDQTVVKINEGHLEIIKSALKAYQAKATKPPGFSDYKVDANTIIYIDVDRYDSTLARLLWLEFWFDWAISSCKIPAIYAL